MFHFVQRDEQSKDRLITRRLLRLEEDQLPIGLTDSSRGNSKWAKVSKFDSLPDSFVMAGLGEVLMDVFEDGKATLGGAPFNAAFHLHQLLTTCAAGDAWIVSAVGKDHWGDKILSRLIQDAMVAEYIVIDAEHSSGTSSVLENHGEAGYEIHADVAWDYLEMTPAIEALALRCDAVVFGSLAQRAEISRRMIQGFVAKVDGPRLYDVNLRRNTSDGVAGYSKEIIEQSLGLATIGKLNGEELEEIGGMFGCKSDATEETTRAWELMEQLRQRFSLIAVVVTRGLKGALFLTADEKLTLPDSQVSQEDIHPVGGGDAFSAGLLFGINLGWPHKACLKLADALSSWVVQEISATPVFSAEIRQQVLTLFAIQSGTAVAWPLLEREEIYAAD